MIQSENYSIAPQGLIKGGDCSYSVDLATGQLKYSMNVQAGIWFFTKTYAYSGEMTIAPAVLLSSNVPQVAGDPTSVVISPPANGVPAQCAFSIPKDQLHGVASVAVDQQYISIPAATINAVVSGQAVQISLIKQLPKKSLWARLFGGVK